MEKKNSFIHDLLSVGLSNFIVLLCSIITGFLVPKMLGVTEHGYYKIFTLYSTYTAMMHFGFVDGVLLENAGKEYSELNKKRFRLNTTFFIKMQIVVATIVAAIALIFVNGPCRILIVMLGVDTFAVNMTAYFQYVSQSTMRFKELSTRKILLATLKIVLTAFLIFLLKLKVISNVYAWMYVGGLVLINTALTGWYIFTYRDITFGEHDKFADGKDEIIKYFKTGFILTVSFEVSNIIFTLDRQFVSVLFDTETYSVYSFAYNLISMVTRVINAVALVLFPRLKQRSVEKIVSSFSPSISYISLVASGAMVGYYPISVLINWILSDYITSLPYFRILFPGLALSCSINIIMFTYYKAINKHVHFFKISCVVLLVSALLNYLAYKMYESPLAISIASIITLLLWYLVSVRYFVVKYGVKWRANFLYEILCMSIFYLATGLCGNDLIATIIYAVSYAILTWIFFRDLLHDTLKILWRRKAK